ncbi:hypothetical protein C0J45_19000 [Silurus meridionalis]|nr:hypothetical protein C0J45_19000 [Silurus meridionalis]
MINVISAYGPQVGCEMEEKEKFWSELDEVLDGVPKKEQLVIGADFNGNVGKGSRRDEEVMGTYGSKERNVEGQMVVDFAERMEMAVVNTYFKKKDHRVTYKSGGRCALVDYVLCRRCNLKEIGDCKMLAGDSVARQHWMVVCRMVLEVKKRRRVRTERRRRCWKLKEEDCSESFREEVRQGLGGGEGVRDDWATTAELIRETARKFELIDTLAQSHKKAGLIMNGTSQAGGGGGVIVWGIFSWHTLGLLVPIEHRVNATAYLSIVADLWDVVEREIRIMDVQQLPDAIIGQYGPKSLRNVSSTLLNLCHEGLRQF